MAQHFQSRKDLIAEIERLQHQIAQMEGSRSGQPTVTDTVSSAGELYRILFEQAGDSIFIVDPETLRILTANENGARRLGYTVENIRKLHFSDIEVSEQKKLEDTKTFSWQSTISGLFVYESIHRRKDGTAFPVEVSSSLIYLDGQQVIQNIVRDVTQRKLIEQHNRDIFMERERVKLLSGFIEQATHQFRTPLSIINTSSYLLMKSDDVGNREELADKIKTQVDHISRLVDGLIMLATLAENRDLERVPFEITQKLQTFTDHLRERAAPHQIAVYLEIEETSVMINGNWEHLDIAFQQLCDNAINSIDSNGAITVRVSTSDQQVAIEIYDTGSGIYADHMPYIFDTFFRADKVGTTRGLGLGLPIVKLIVDIHHGMIEVESEEGKGSLFRILLPLEKNTA